MAHASYSSIQQSTVTDAEGWLDPLEPFRAMAAKPDHDAELVRLRDACVAYDERLALEWSRISGLPPGDQAAAWDEVFALEPCDVDEALAFEPTTLDGLVAQAGIIMSRLRDAVEPEHWAYALAEKVVRVVTDIQRAPLLPGPAAPPAEP